jgi:hypothetical protein
MVGAAALVAAFFAAILVVHFFVRPLDQAFASLISRLLE